MYTASKYMGQNLVKSETLPNIALPNRCDYTASKKIRLPYGRTLVSYLLCVVTAVWRLKGVRPLFISISVKFLSNTCQTATKICSRCIVRLSHPYSLRNRPILCIVPFGRRISLRHGLRRVRKPILSRSVAALLSGCVWSHLVSMTNAIRSLLWAAPLWSCERQKSRVSRWSGSRSVCVNPATFNHTTL